MEPRLVQLASVSKGAVVKPKQVYRPRLGAADIEIPGRFALLKARDVITLANAIAAPPVKTRNAALDVIEAELARRRSKAA